MPGDAAAMQRLYDEHAGALWAFCLHLTGNDRARAEDVAQETLLRAWRNADALTDARGSVRSWLFTVARNIVIDEWRTKRARNEQPTAEIPDVVATPDPADDVVRSALVTEALRELSADHRAVIIECYYKGRSVADAAKHLGVPPGTVKSRCHYALRALRAALEEMGVVP